MYLAEKELEREFNRKMLEEDRAAYKPHYNSDGFRYLGMPIITSDHPDAIEILEWGLIPIWAKNDKDANVIRKGALNAKAETLFELKSFKSIAPVKRCLILVNGIFEPHENPDGSTTYYYITRKSRKAFAIGGLWNRWKNPDTGIYRKSFTMITTAATPKMAELHNRGDKGRMVFMLPENLQDIWISKDLTTPDIKSLMVPFEDEDDLESWPVSKLINNRRNNSDVPDIIKRVDPSIGLTLSLF